MRASQGNKMFWLQVIVTIHFISFIPSALAQDRSVQDSQTAIISTAPSLKVDGSPSPTVGPIVPTNNGDPSAAAGGAAKTHTVQVGLDHKFKPDEIKARIGDIVEFSFMPQNHSVVRAEFGYPCIPYEMTGEGKTGFFSGMQSVDTIKDNPPKWSLRVNDSSPVFFYCSAIGSCTDWGMVGAINPNSSTPLSTQIALAKDSAYVLQPGEPFPFESPLPSGLPALPTNTLLPAAPSSPAKPGSGSKPRLSSGAIAGIVIASVSVLALAGLLLFFIGRSRALRDEVHRKDSTVGARRTTEDYNKPSPSVVPHSIIVAPAPTPPPPPPHMEEIYPSPSQSPRPPAYHSINYPHSQSPNPTYPYATVHSPHSGYAISPPPHLSTTTDYFSLSPCPPPSLPLHLPPPPPPPPHGHTQYPTTHSSRTTSPLPPLPSSTSGKHDSTTAPIPIHQHPAFRSYPDHTTAVTVDRSPSNGSSGGTFEASSSGKEYHYRMYDPHDNGDGNGNGNGNGGMYVVIDEKDEDRVIGSGQRGQEEPVELDGTGLR